MIKYNIPAGDRDAFFANLAETIKPGGEVHITIVDDCILEDLRGHTHLLDTIGNYFNSTAVRIRKTVDGADALITCREPKLESRPDERISVSPKPILGFDMGPNNRLLDAWIAKI